MPGEPVVSRDLSYLDPELTSAYRQLPVQTLAYSAFAPAPGCGEAVVVVGGETEVNWVIYLGYLGVDSSGLPGPRGRTAAVVLSDACLKVDVSHQ